MSTEWMKKLLKNSTTMPLGTGLGQSGQAGQNSTLLNMHTNRGGPSHGHGCGCGHHHHDHDDEDEA